MIKYTLIIDSARPLSAVGNSLVQTRYIPLRKGYADDGNLESAFFTIANSAGKIILCARSPVAP